MRIRFFGLMPSPLAFAFSLLCVVLFALCVSVEAQTKVASVGELIFRPGSTLDLGTGRKLFRRSLRELGYVEGKTIAYETRSAAGKIDRFPALAEELVRLKVDVLIASSTSEALAFKNATRTIPIVYIGPTDLVAAGVVDSLARPGGNITGFTTVGLELVGKQLDILKETVPKLSGVALLWNPKSRGNEQTWKETQLAARELRLQLHSMEVSSADKYESAIKEAIAAGSNALCVRRSPLVSFNRKLIVGLASKHRLPAIFDRGDFAESGGLMSYGPDPSEPYKRAAWMVDKILKGAKPADIPVERPKQFELVINLKAAKQIDLTIPPNVLARADRVIK